VALAQCEFEVATEAAALHEHDGVLERRPHVVFEAIGKRFDARAILESILKPSKVVDPKYHATTWVLADGRVVTGRANMVNDREIGVEVNALTGESQKLLRSDIESSHPSPVSPMPQGLLDTLEEEEILDLVALLRGGG
jgi:putative heme-binding domain-containing protein